MITTWVNDFQLSGKFRASIKYGFAFIVQSSIKRGQFGKTSKFENV